MAQTSFNQRPMVMISPEYTVKLKQLMMVLLHRRNLVAGVSGITLLIAVVLAILAKPTYQSSMQILVSSNSEKDQTNKDEEIDFNSQFKLMLSSQLIDKAVKLLHLANSEIQAEDIKGKNAQDSPLKLVRLNNEFGRSQEEIFDFTYQTDNSYESKQVLEALKQVYQDYNLEQKKQEKDRIAEVVNQQLSKVKQELKQAEDQFLSFRKKHDFADFQLQSKTALNKLKDTKNQIQVIRTQLQKLQANSQNLEKQLNSPFRNVFTVPSLVKTKNQVLLNELKKTEIALAKERIRYTEYSPVVQKLVEQHQMQMSLLKKELGLFGEESKLVKSSQDLVLSPIAMTAMNLKLTEEIINLKTKTSELVGKEKSLLAAEQRLKNESSNYFHLLTEQNRLEQEISRNRKSLDKLVESQNSVDIKVTQTGFNWKILESPERGISIGNDKLSFLLWGMIIAPILGILAAFCWELLSDTVYCSQEFQELTNVRLLGKIPKLSGNKKQKHPIISFPEIATLFVDSPQHLSNSSSHEAIDIAYQNIQVLNSPFPCKSLMVTCAGTGEGKSDLLVGFAVSAARMHQRVLIIDANWHNPTLHKTLDLSNEWGLSLLLVDEENPSFQDYIQPIHPSIDVLTAGVMPEDSLKLLSSNRMKELLEYFEQIYDVVLIDTPQILKTIDARILATLSKGIIMVERMGQVTRSELAEAIAILNQHNLIGAIANLG
ncbi:GumC family protein [Calothrix sp. PCC 6303]|uniref:GumC family protein n=1 Tax=Calothrix sp. PCC 6303 TaxID=1170562 RepID=UPI0002A04FAF|nr:polysaccharide biosynthesis tyrosine autokinase [Calothrix sp. PCC 6303]AFY99544.1 lipopolysaccharide biosynthesis protein [Calothrix sp. PCC 6303]